MGEKLGINTEEKYYNPEKQKKLKRELDELPKAIKELTRKHLLDIEDIKEIIDAKDFEGINLFIEQVRLLERLYNSNDLAEKYYEEDKK